MGQNSSVDICDRKNNKKVENSSSGLTVLQTIVQRRGSTTKVKRHIHQKKENLDYVIDVKNKTKHVGGKETIAELIRHSKKQNSLKHQKRFLERLIENKRSCLSNDVYHHFDHCRPHSTSIKMSDESSTKQNKSIKNWTIKDKNRPKIPSNLSIHTVYTSNKQNKVEDNGDNKHKIILKKNNQEKVNELFKTLQSKTTDKLERDRRYYYKKKKLLSISHQNALMIPPSNQFNQDKTFLKPHDQQFDSKYHLDQLTKQHLQRQTYVQKTNDLKIINNNENDFQSLLSELRCKISPLQHNSRLSSTTCNKDNESVNSVNWSTKSIRVSNETLYITDISEIQDRFRTYSITEAVEVEKKSTLDKSNKNSENFDQINSNGQKPNYNIDERKNHSSKHKHKSLNKVEENKLCGEQSVINQKRYRSINNNSKIYYYKTFDPTNEETDFVEYPLPKVPTESKKCDENNLNRVKNTTVSNNRKITWIQDDENNWQKIVL